MEIIPVLDLKAGRVVHANDGARINYPPLQSALSPDGVPLPLVRTLLENYAIRRLYIADLDAIANTGNHNDVIHLIRQSFPELELWVDAGIRTADSLHRFYQRQTVRPVIGSETLTSLELPRKQTPIHAEPILSLDFNADGLLGLQQLGQQPGLWPRDVIIMSLDHVGTNRGPDFSRLRQYKNLADKHRLFAAGGVRNKQDLIALAEAGISGALVATALHNGQIEPRPRITGA